ncbi:MAG: hypothetical protein RI910_36 [Verrucomicrobiota bacterium]
MSDRVPVSRHSAARARIGRAGRRVFVLGASADLSLLSPAVEKSSVVEVLNAPGS